MTTRGKRDLDGIPIFLQYAIQHFLSSEELTRKGILDVDISVTY